MRLRPWECSGVGDVAIAVESVPIGWAIPMHPQAAIGMRAHAVGWLMPGGVVLDGFATCDATEATCPW